MKEEEFNRHKRGKKFFLIRIDNINLPKNNFGKQHSLTTQQSFSLLCTHRNQVVTHLLQEAIGHRGSLTLQALRVKYYWPKSQTIIPPTSAATGFGEGLSEPEGESAKISRKKEYRKGDSSFQILEYENMSLGASAAILSSRISSFSFLSETMHKIGEQSL